MSTPGRNNRSIRTLFAFSDDECRFLADRHGTPAFVYCADRACAQLAALRAVVPDRVRVAYAVKANPLPSLLAAFAAEGASFDCASLGELDRLASLGVDPARILFAGPGKRDHEIEAAVGRGVRIQAEGIEDLRRVDALAAARGLDPIAVNLRVQPLGVKETLGRPYGNSNRGASILGGSILGGSGPSAFGVDEEDLPSLLAEAATLRHVTIRGIHGFAASNERDAERLLANHGRMMSIARRLHEGGLVLDQVDLGGGLGVPYAVDHEPLDLVALGRGLHDLLARHAWFTGELVIEPGRFLAAGCGVYLARVVRMKASRGTRFAILEGGINHLLRPLLTGQPFPVRAVARSDTEGQRAVQATALAGPLCTGLDRLGTVPLPDLVPGDLLAFGMTGAYGATEAMTHFLDHPRAREIWVEDVHARKGCAWYVPDTPDDSARYSDQKVRSSPSGVARAS